MSDFLAQNSLYLVLGIVLVCWLGIFFYLMRLDKRVSRIERKEQ